MTLCPTFAGVTTMSLLERVYSDSTGLPLPDLAVLDRLLASRIAHSDGDRMDIVPPIRKRRYSGGPGMGSPRKRVCPAPPPSPCSVPSSTDAAAAAAAAYLWEENEEGSTTAHLHDDIDLFAMLPDEVILHMAEVALVHHPWSIIALASTSHRMNGVLKDYHSTPLWQRVADAFGMDIMRHDNAPRSHRKDTTTSYAYRAVMAACQRPYVLWSDARMRCFAFGGFGDAHATWCSAKRGPRTGSCCLTAEDVHCNETILTRVANDLLGADRSQRRLFISQSLPLLSHGVDDDDFASLFMDTDPTVPMGRESDDDNDNDNDYPSTEAGDDDDAAVAPSPSSSPFHTPPRLLRPDSATVQPPGAPLRNRDARRGPSIRSLVMSMTIGDTPLDEYENENDSHEDREGEDTTRSRLWDRPIRSFRERCAMNRELLTDHPDKWFAATMMRSVRSATGKPVMSLGPLGFRHNHAKVIEAVYRAVLSHTHATTPPPTNWAAATTVDTLAAQTPRITSNEIKEMGAWLCNGNRMHAGPAGIRYPFIYMALVACNVLSFTQGVKIMRCMTASRPYEWHSAPCTCTEDTSTSAMAWLIATGDAHSSCPFHGGSAMDAVRCHRDIVDVADAATRRDAALSGAIRRIVCETMHPHTAHSPPAALLPRQRRRTSLSPSKPTPRPL